MVYSKLYESLQRILRRSSWPPIPGEFSASFSRTLLSWTGPFPGVWTCKTGVILWKQTTESPMLKVFLLDHGQRAPLQELTKCYWHFIFGSNSFAGNHRSLFLRVLRKHEKLLRPYEPGKSVTRDKKFSLTGSESISNHVVEGKCERILPSFMLHSRVISLIYTFIEHTVGYLRTWGCCEPALVEGKARVRWRCVSGPYPL